MSPDVASLHRVLAEGAFTTVFHPAFSLTTGALISVEALTRIELGSRRSPAWWLSEAHLAGLGVELELAILQRSLASAAPLPDDVTLSVNLSPTALVHPAVLATLEEGPSERVTVELTERPSLHVHPHLLRQRDRLREAGIGLAVGNVAAQRTSMARLLALRPDQVKTDLWLTAGIDTDPVRRTMARTLVRVARHQRAHVVAEGVETPAQLATWKQLGADAVQGFLLATPTPLDEALRTAAITVP